jgi:hypothetical protein
MEWRRRAHDQQCFFFLELIVGLEFFISLYWLSVDMFFSLLLVETPVGIARHL